MSRFPARQKHKRRYQLGILAVLIVLQQGLWTGGGDRVSAGVPAALIYHVVVCLVSAVLFWVFLRGGRDQSEDPR